MPLEQQAAEPRAAPGGPLSHGGYSRKQILIFTSCVLSLLVLGWVDYATGYELGFFIVYSVPVGLVAWHLGRWPAILMALLASIAWWLADSFDGAKYSSAFYWVWNNAVHFLSFVINAVAIAKIKDELDEVHKLAAELVAARSMLSAVAPLLSACPACGKPHPPVSGSGRSALPEHRPLPPELAAALCADCAAQTPRATPS
jgi:K+-sensing histidine kinase KdpD